MDDTQKQNRQNDSADNQAETPDKAQSVQHSTAIVEEAGQLEPAGEQTRDLEDQQASEPAESKEEQETDKDSSETTESTDQAETPTEADSVEVKDTTDKAETSIQSDTPGRWYVVHTFSGHENKVATNLKQRIESEHLDNKIFDILVPTQDKIEIRSGKKEQVKEKIFPGYILVKMLLDDQAWLAVRTTQGVTAFVGMNNRPTPISDKEVQSIVKFMNQGAPATFKDVFLVDDTVKIIDGPFADFIGKVDSVDKEKGKVRVLVSIFGRETPVELDFLQVTKL